MNRHENGDIPLRIDFAYASADNHLFGEAIYRPDAKLRLYKDLANIVLRAGEICYERCGRGLILYDGLRTVDAQEAMMRTQRVKDNPHWLEEPRLLSIPGAGGHPRGMAVDVSIEGLDMGTVFDDLSERAHRDYQELPQEILKNRQLLEDVMMEAASELNIPLLPLPEEWWDFRLLPSFSNQFAPLRDQDLPTEFRMCRL